LQSKVQAKAFGVKNVSSSFGRQIAKDALLAIFFSLFLVVLYIAIRFDLKFAGPVIIAMIHDVVITVGVYSVTGREVTTSTVAAGAHSSIFIAAPTLTIWKAREPEFARRVEHKTDDHAEGLLAEAEQLAAAEPAAPLEPVAAVERLVSGDGSKRERRRQRRR